LVLNRLLAAPPLGLRGSDRRHERSGDSEDQEGGRTVEPEHVKVSARSGPTSKANVGPLVPCQI
jgi:hypothetical protein